MIRKTEILVLILLGCTTIVGQTPNWIWAKQSNINCSNTNNCITIDAVGNTYITGSFASDVVNFGTISLTNNGELDCFIAKYDSTGNVLWAKNSGGTKYDYGNGITCDEIGNTYITGCFKSESIAFDTVVLYKNQIDQNTIFIAKYNSSGNVLWAKAIGGVTNEDIIQSIAVDKFGNSYVAGSFASSSMNVGSTTLTNTGQTDVFIAKFDQSGNEVWAKSATGNSYDVSRSIACSSEGNIYITGNFCGTSIKFGNQTLNNSGNCDVFVTKYDSSGNVVWAKSAQGNLTDIPYCIAIDSRENIYLTGSFSSSSVNFGDITLTNENGQEEVFIVKYNSLGEAKWAKTAGTEIDDAGFGITTDGYDNVYVSGFFEWGFILFDGYSLNGMGDSFIVKYDSLGTILWATSISGGGTRDLAQSIKADDMGYLYVVGRFNSGSINIGGFVLNNSGSADELYVAKLAKEVETVHVYETNNKEIRISPNPTSNIITIETLRKADIEILNIEGQIIKRINATDAMTTIDLQEISSGVYIVKVITDKEIVTKKLIKK